MIDLWLTAIEIGFVGFVLSLFGLIWQGCNRSGVWKRSAWAWLISATLFFSLWLLALPRAPRP